VDDSVVAGESEYVFVTASPRQTHGYYFARLEDDKGTPASPDYSFDTYANEAPNRCSRNLINLLFKAKDATLQGSR
jgi:hypothetical protein